MRPLAALLSALLVWPPQLLGQTVGVALTGAGGQPVVPVVPGPGPSAGGTLDLAPLSAPLGPGALPVLSALPTARLSPAGLAVPAPIASPIVAAAYAPPLALPTPAPGAPARVLSAPELSPASAFGRAASLQPATPASPARAPGPAAARPLAQRVAGLFAASAGDLKSLPAASAEGSRAVGSLSIARLLGLPGAPSRPAVDAAALSPRSSRTLGAALRHASDPAPPSPPSPAAPAPARSQTGTLRWYLGGTATFKLGMESLTLAVPLLAMTAFGSVTWAAVMAMGWVLSQALFGSIAGGVLDRRSPSKVLAWAMAGQALAVGALAALYFGDVFLPGALGFKLFTPVSLLAFYSLAGGFMGVSDTARAVIPPEVIGQDERRIKIFNAKTHVAYEVAGVIGALGAGWVITHFGLAAALLVHPPAYLLAAWVFSRLRLATPDGPVPTALPRSPAGLLAAARRTLDDLREGMRTVMGHPMFRWGMLALLVPLITHRLLEGLLIPAFAKVILAAPAQAAWLMGASNFGELLGALFLMRAMLSDNPNVSRTHFWVRLMALGAMGIWAMSFTTDLWVILPLLAFRSLSWAASDLSLRGKLQNSLPEAVRGRAFGFIGAVGYLGILAASLSVGFLMDALGAGPVFLGVNVVLSLLALWLWRAGSKLQKIPKPNA